MRDNTQDVRSLRIECRGFGRAVRRGPCAGGAGRGGRENRQNRRLGAGLGMIAPWLFSISRDQSKSQDHAPEAGK